MQMIIFDQSYFLVFLLDFITIFRKKELKLCKISPVFVNDTLETLKHQNLLSLVFLCARCNFSQMLLSVH